MKPFTCKVHVSPWTVTQPTASIHHWQTCVRSHYKWANSHVAHCFHTPQANLHPLTLQMGQQSRGPPLSYTTGNPVSTHVTNGPTVTWPTASIHHRQTCIHSHYKWANSHAAHRFHTPQAILCPLTLQMGQQSRGPPLSYTTGNPVSTHITNGPTVMWPTTSIHHRQTCVHSRYKWANSHAAHSFHTPQANLHPLTLQMGQQNFH